MRNSDKQVTWREEERQQALRNYLVLVFAFVLLCLCLCCWFFVFAFFWGGGWRGGEGGGGLLSVSTTDKCISRNGSR